MSQMLYHIKYVVKHTGVQYAILTSIFVGWGCAAWLTPVTLMNWTLVSDSVYPEFIMWIKFTILFGRSYFTLKTKMYFDLSLFKASIFKATVQLFWKGFLEKGVSRWYIISCTVANLNDLILEKTRVNLNGSMS